jgi:hypothetical protein
MESAVASSPLHAAYATTVDRESAREMLARRLEQGAAKAEAEPTPGPTAGSAPAPGQEKVAYPAPTRPPTTPQADSMMTEVLQSTAAKEFMRTAAREIARGVFGIGRR